MKKSLVTVVKSHLVGWALLLGFGGLCFGTYQFFTRPTPEWVTGPLMYAEYWGALAGGAMIGGVAFSVVMGTLTGVHAYEEQKDEPKT